MEKENTLTPSIVNDIYNWLRKGVYNLKQQRYSSKQVVIYVSAGIITELEFLKPARSSDMGEFDDRSLMFYGVDILPTNEADTIIMTNLKPGYTPSHVITYTIKVKQTGIVDTSVSTT